MKTISLFHSSVQEFHVSDRHRQKCNPHKSHRDFPPKHLRFHLTIRDYDMSSSSLFFTFPITSSANAAKSSSEISTTLSYKSLSQISSIMALGDKTTSLLIPA